MLRYEVAFYDSTFAFNFTHLADAFQKKKHYKWGGIQYKHLNVWELQVLQKYQQAGQRISVGIKEQKEAANEHSGRIYW